MNITVLDLATDAVQMQLIMTVPGGFNGFVSFGVTTGGRRTPLGASRSSRSRQRRLRARALCTRLRRRSGVAACKSPARSATAARVGTTLTMSLWGEVNTFGGGLGLGFMATTG